MKSGNHFIADMPRREFLQASLKGGIALAASPSLMPSLLSAVDAGAATAKPALDPQMLNRTIQALKKRRQVVSANHPQKTGEWLALPELTVKE